jgi:DNA-binding ferritin-like protein
MDLITKFLTLHNQLKVYHWQTESYAQHQAFGSAYDEFTGYIDQFIEEFMGKNARIMAKGMSSNEKSNGTYSH